MQNGCTRAIPFITTNRRGEIEVIEGGGGITGQTTTTFRTADAARHYVYETRGYDRCHVEYAPGF